MPSPATRPKIGILVHDARLWEQLGGSLRGDFEVFHATDAESGWPLIEQIAPDLLLLNLTPGPVNVRRCLALLDDLRDADLDTLVIVLSSDRKKTTALRVIDAGVYDYFVHPVDPDVLRPLIDRAVEKLRVERENRILREQIHRRDALGSLIGGSEPMRGIFDLIRRVASTATTVCIRGESGTGKELVARAIHDLSDRRGRPFISVNCAALPESLMEAELFGHEKGAFTGAVDAKEGRIELAQRGTLFLDEIGTLSPTLQSKLLRVLEEHALIRLGGKRTIRVDFRLLTATNADLEEHVRLDRFREDLYYRIQVVPIYLPPLRERGEDITLLVDHFVKVYCTANHTPPKRVSDDALQALKRYNWPGNVRELENAIQRIVLMTDGPVINLKDVPQDIAAAAARDGRERFCIPSGGLRLEQEVAAYEKRWVEAALAQAGGIKAQAARMLGLNKEKMKYLCRKYEL
jgi:DNA-binding NtrC family response regulator